jgi:hypothetical protein
MKRVKELVEDFSGVYLESGCLTSRRSRSVSRR